MSRCRLDGSENVHHFEGPVPLSHNGAKVTFSEPLKTVETVHLERHLIGLYHVS